MAGPSAATAAVRVAVRRSLHRGRVNAGVLVACSGGPDSLALAAAARFVVPRLGLKCGLVTVDHGLQEGSTGRAADVVAWAVDAGFDPAVAVPVEVAGRPGGPEAAARQARYEALAGVARSYGAAAVLLGHTRDDQAETVFLSLARGGGPRGLAGMPERRDVDGVPFLRPFLGLPRATVHAACAEAGLTPWEDPHNSDAAYARSRVRQALPLLVDALGPDLVANLARVASLTAADNAVLDELAAAALAEARAVRPEDGAATAVADSTPGRGVGDAPGRVFGDAPVPGAAASGSAGLRIDVLAGLPGAVRTRVLRLFAAELGGKALSHTHLAAMDALVTDWHGQGPVALPGGVWVRRNRGVLSRGWPAAG